MSARVLVFGRMGQIGEEVSTRLSSLGYVVSYVPFDQNLFRDFFGYSRSLTKAVDSFGPDYVLPVGDMLASSKLKPVLEESRKGLKVCCGKESDISLLDRKTTLYSFASSLGVLQPELFEDYLLISDWMNVVFKRDLSFGGHGVHRPRSLSALENLIAHQSPSEPFLVERFVEGQQWSVDVVRCPSFEKFSSYKCVMSKGCGPSIRRIVEPFEELGIIALSILDKLDFRGVCGFDFIVDSSGKPYLLESNPRFTGGIASQIEAGFDIPEMLIEAFSDEKHLLPANTYPENMLDSSTAAS